MSIEVKQYQNNAQWEAFLTSNFRPNHTHTLIRNLRTGNALEQRHVAGYPNSAYSNAREGDVLSNRDLPRFLRCDVFARPKQSTFTVGQSTAAQLWVLHWRPNRHNKAVLTLSHVTTARGPTEVRLFRFFVSDILQWQSHVVNKRKAKLKYVRLQPYDTLKCCRKYKSNNNLSTVGMTSTKQNNALK